MPPEEENKDVKDNSSSSSDSDDSSNKKVDEDRSDKEYNFAALRKSKEDADKRIKELEEENKLLKETKDRREGERRGRRILAGQEPDKKHGKDDDGDDDEKERRDASLTAEFNKTLFDRDKQKATRRWNEEHPDVTDVEWNSICENVVLKGDEDDEMIYRKINFAYESLPSVQARREKQLIEKGRQEALREFSDSEMDIGAGGDSVSGSDKSKKKKHILPRHIGPEGWYSKE